MAIICIVLAGLMYQLTAPDFKNFSYASLSALEVASIVYVFFCSFLGFATFMVPRFTILATYMTFTIVSFLFTVAVSVFAIVAGSSKF